MKIPRRFNKFSIGITLGALLPLLFFLLIFIIAHADSTFKEFIQRTHSMLVLPKIMSLCIIPNLAIFYFFLNKEFWYTTRGIIAATLIYTLVIFVIIFFI